MPNPTPFDRKDLRAEFPVPDLAAIAAQRAAEAANPWHGIQINVNRIPPSALFDIFLTESIEASNQAVAIANMMANGTLPKTPDGRPIQASAAAMLVQTTLAIANQKATLANACAAMALALTSAATAAETYKTLDISADPTLPRWYGPDGSKETGWAAVYLATIKAETSAAADKPLQFSLSPE